MLNKRKFYYFINTLDPTKYDRLHDSKHKSFKSKSLNTMIYCRDRYFLAIDAALKNTNTSNPVICDLGVFPGSLINILYNILKIRNMNPKLYGIGISTPPDFKQIMKDKFETEILTVNFDPKNPDLIDKNYPTSINLPQNSVDIVFATEVIEHLMNPVHMLKESYKILKPGGIIAITTQNVVRIGNILKLIAVKSNLDRLTPIGYSNPDDEWRPHFREYTLQELISLFKSCSYEILDYKYFVTEQDSFNITSFGQKIKNLIKLPFLIVPRLRGDILLVARKPKP